MKQRGPIRQVIRLSYYEFRCWESECRYEALLDVAVPDKDNLCSILKIA
jgi:hypothetical protein